LRRAQPCHDYSQGRIDTISTRSSLANSTALYFNTVEQNAREAPMSLQFNSLTDDELEAEIDAVADLTEQVVLTLAEGPRQYARSALECALAMVIAAEANHNAGRADDMLCRDLFPSLRQLVEEECESPGVTYETLQ
jgi:hypothetical protein